MKIIILFMKYKASSHSKTAVIKSLQEFYEGGTRNITSGKRGVITIEYMILCANLQLHLIVGLGCP